jgi:carboxyl-terminal processing protease
MNKKMVKILLLMGTFAVVTGGTAVAFKHWAPELTKNEQNYLRLFREVLTVVKESYVDEVDGKKLMEGSVKGMLASLDPHSAYLPPEPFKEMKVEMSGSFGGLGIEINVKDGKLTVIAPIEDTPAFRAGIKANDHIVKIGDTPTQGMTIADAVKLMRGPKGSSVTLNIRRESSPEQLSFPLVRDIIKTKSVKFRTLDPGYGYVQISQFRERTGDEFKIALQSLREQNGGALQGLVFDLRNNPGGFVEEAIMVANRFIGESIRNGLIVYTQGRGTSAKQEYNATIGEKEPHYPMVVLINGASASASEIVAGALQDQQRAVIMGTQSFGKGSIQNILPLADGAGLKLTTARYYTPKGRSIQAKGITPDIIVNRLDLPAAAAEKRPEFHENDLDHHLSTSEEKGRETREKPVKSEPAIRHDEETAKDYQLVRALELVRGLVQMQNIR